MDDQPLEICAFEEGVFYGQRPNGSAVDCPFHQDALPVRTAWLKGFSVGRATRAHPDFDAVRA